MKTTSVYVTHDQIEAMTLADRLVVLNKGHVEQQGSPLDLYNRPANLFVAGFIGSPAMNFLEANAVRSEGRLHTQLAGGDVLELDPALSVNDGQEIVLGLRPELICNDGGGRPCAARSS